MKCKSRTIKLNEKKIFLMKSIILTNDIIINLKKQKKRVRSIIYLYLYEYCYHGNGMLKPLCLKQSAVIVYCDRQTIVY